MVKIGAATCGLTLLMLTVTRTSCRPTDMLILLDDSADITDADWTAIKHDLIGLVINVCAFMEPEPTPTKLSLATFSSTVQHRFNTTDISAIRWPVYVTALRRMTQTKGRNRCMGRALDYATEFLSSLPPSTQRFSEVLILSSGVERCPGYYGGLAGPIRRLQSRAFVFALQLGTVSSAGRRQIESLVSKPLIDHIFSLANFQYLHRMVDAIKTYPDTCAPIELS